MNNTPITKLHVSIINIKLTTTHPKLQVAQQNSKSKTTIVYAKANNNLPSNALFLQLQSRFDLKFLINLTSTAQTYFHQSDPSDSFIGNLVCSSSVLLFNIMAPKKHASWRMNIQLLFGVSHLNTNYIFQRTILRNGK